MEKSKNSNSCACMLCASLFKTRSITLTGQSGSPRQQCIGVISAFLLMALACEQGEGKERGGRKGRRKREEEKGGGKGRRKRESVGMAKVFYFQMPVIHAMLKLVIWVISTTTTSNFE